MKQEEHSSLRHSISYSVLTAEPALSYSSVISTITLHAITSGASAGQTFIEWSGQFSSDADASVVSDAKFKRQDAFEDLVKCVSLLLLRSAYLLMMPLAQGCQGLNPPDFSLPLFFLSSKRNPETP